MTTTHLPEVTGRGVLRTVAEGVADMGTFVGRSLRHTMRSIDAMLTAIMLPVVILLMFVYVFGGAIQTPGDYIDYVVPGILLLCVSMGAAGTAVGVHTDMATGIIDRFRSMPILGVAVLAGHMVTSVLRNLVSTAVVVGVAVAIGFRPVAGPLEWLGVVGVLALFVFAISSLATAFGLVVRSAEAAGAFIFPVMFLPYVSSAFVPTESMPRILHAFATHQPSTPIIETLRGLLLGLPLDGAALPAVLWCTGLAIVGVAASAWCFRRASSR